MGDLVGEEVARVDMVAVVGMEEVGMGRRWRQEELQEY